QEDSLVQIHPLEKKKYSIVVVDDNQAAAWGLGELLKHKGHRVELGYDGAEAIELVKKHSPDIVVLDIGLPNMNGYEVARRLRQDFFSPMILVALTGYGQEDDKRRATEAGFDYHLTKPISIVDIEKIIEGL